MGIKNIKLIDFYLSGIFFLFLFLFQVKFLDFNLGVLTSYVNNFNALNELAFWTQFNNPLFIETPLNNPLKYNIISNLIYLLSLLFSNQFIFTILPVLFSVFSFYLSIKIYKLYGLNIYWSGLLSFLGITSISSLPIASSLLSILKLDISYIKDTNHYFDLLTSFSSSFVLFVFLFMLYISLREQKSLTKFKPFIPALWCSSVFVHPSIFIFGYAFILIINIIREYRAYEKKDYKLSLYKFCCINFLPLIIAAPYFLMNLNFFNINSGEISFSFSYLIFLKSISLYFILPFALMLISSSIYKLDPFEILVKFWPIFLIAFLELILRVFSIPGFLSINSSTILDRVSMYFLHFFYYVPFLSIIGKKFTYLPVIQKEEISLSDQIRSMFTFFYKRLSIPLSIILIGLVTVNSFSSFKSNFYNEIDNHASNIMATVNLLNVPKNNIAFVAIDDNLIYSYLSQSVLPFNSFFSSKQDINKNLKQDVISNIIFGDSKKNLDNNLSELNIYNSFDKEILNSIERQRKLLSWLNVTYHDSSNKNASYSNNLSEKFLEENYLITKESIKSIEDLEFIIKKNINEYLLYTK